MQRSVVSHVKSICGVRGEVVSQSGIVPIRGMGFTDVHVAHGPFGGHVHTAVTHVLVMIHIGDSKGLGSDVV